MTDKQQLLKRVNEWMDYDLENNEHIENPEFRLIRDLAAYLATDNTTNRLRAALVVANDTLKRTDKALVLEGWVIHENSIRECIRDSLKLNKQALTPNPDKE